MMVDPHRYEILEKGGAGECNQQPGGNQQAIAERRENPSEQQEQRQDQQLGIERDRPTLTGGVAKQWLQ